MSRKQEHRPSFADTTDFENASRGFIGALEPGIITNHSGRVVWDIDVYKFLQSECPPTANPSLWRQCQLTSIQGLFEVTRGIYQIRGFDISNMTIVEGHTGIIVIDPLISNECAKVGLELYRKHRGDRPVTGMIFSHSHTDHFGGAEGVLPKAVHHSEIPIIAPEGFWEEATSENIMVGPAMRARALYMYGSRLPKGPEGHIGNGLGINSSAGRKSMIPPNVIIKDTGEECLVDGVKIVFQMVPGTEAPAEFNFYFPDHRALCIAECATHCLHNVITLRGALVRDAQAWSGYLDETATLYGSQSDVLFSSHHWPAWGSSTIINFISEQRDLYAYLHDQTVRMMNLGKTGIEIAEELTLPPTLQKLWHTQGYYGSISHNVKGIYQRYMTWFDGNPIHLWQHPPSEEGKRYVACMGGIDSVILKAHEYTKAGDLRFAATLLGHAVAANPSHQPAKLALATVLEKLGFGAENATWRNFYLTGAQELRTEKHVARAATTMTATNPMLSIDQWLAGMSVMVDGPRAATQPAFILDIHVPEERRRWRVLLSNGALTHRSQPADQQQNFDGRPAGLELRLSKQELLEVLKGDMQLARRKGEGDIRLLQRLLDLVAAPEPENSAPPTGRL